MKYRKKPVVIEAEQFVSLERCVPHIHTLEGPHLVSDGDWIIRGIEGEHYPCKPDIMVMRHLRRG